MLSKILFFPSSFLGFLRPNVSLELVVLFTDPDEMESFAPRPKNTKSKLLPLHSPRWAGDDERGRREQGSKK
jgi:hypothetical protein